MPGQDEQLPTQVPKPQDWARVQPYIRQLYVVDQRPLKDVSRILEEQHGFYATQRMYKSRIQAWKYDKKFKESEWRQIIAIWKRRREEEGKESVFKVRGRTITSAKIRKFLKRKKVEESDFLSGPAESEPLSDIQCFTPSGTPPPTSASINRDSPSVASEPDQDPSPVTEKSRTCSLPWTGSSEQDLRDVGRHPSLSNNNNNNHNQPRTLSQPYISVPHFSGLPPPHDPPPLEKHSTILRPPSHLGITSNLRSFNIFRESSTHLVYGIEGMALRTLTPDLVKLEEKDDLILSNLLMSAYPPSLAGERGEAEFLNQRLMASPLTTVPAKITDADIVLCYGKNPEMRSYQSLYVSTEDTLASQWLSRLFQACIFHNQNRPDLVSRNIESAAAIFYNMVKSHNPYLLPGFGIFVGIMTAHNQWPLVADLLLRCCQIAEECLTADHPFTVAFEHMRVICARQNLEPVTAERLERAITHFKLAWGTDHPNTIVLEYHCAWDILGKGDPAQAENKLRNLLPIAQRVMGPSNYVTTGIMRSLSRACKDQGNLQDAIAFMGDAVQRQRRSLGQYHPDRMEGIRRLAQMHESLGDLAAAQDFFDEALWGQVKMLGADNGLTMGTLGQLSDVMKRRGKYEDEAKLQLRIDEIIVQERNRRFETPAEAY